MFSYTGPGQVKKKAMQIAWQGAPMRLTAEYTYNDEGRVATVKYPTTNTAGATYALSYDSMARVSGMTENGASLVSGVSYGAAGQMTAMSWAGWTETFSFNARMQMTRSTISGVYDEEYTFSATQNNGQITKKKDWISGEEVNYTYDSLNRMIAASTTGSGGWGSSYSYDGFGNLTAKTATKGTVPPLSVTVDAATNRLTGQSYDANGNQLTAPSGGTLAYDLANRVMSWGSVETYGYNPGNKRVLKTNTSTHVDTLFFYGLAGRRMGTYQLNGCPGGCYLSTVSTEVYFKGRLVKSGNEAVVVDRLGSVRKRKNLSTSVVSTFDYWPYGEEKPSATANNKDKFGTYYRDSSSGLDYADQRYYRNENGRFMSVDPAGSGLNHYGYVGGDPVNRRDPSGLCGYSESRDGWWDENYSHSFDDWVEEFGGNCLGNQDWEFAYWGPGAILNGAYYTEAVFTTDLYIVNGTVLTNGPITTNCQASNSACPSPGLPNPTPPPVIEEPGPVTVTCPSEPSSPAGDSVTSNIQKALSAQQDFVTSTAADPDFNADFATLMWFYSQVRNSGPWDYKQKDRVPGPRGKSFSPWEAFGNFNFGATGSALGYSAEFLMRMAGWASQRSGNEFGGDPGELWEILMGTGGTSPFGDDPVDQGYIFLGVLFQQLGCR